MILLLGDLDKVPDLQIVEDLHLETARTQELDDNRHRAEVAMQLAKCLPIRIEMGQGL